MSTPSINQVPLTGFILSKCASFPSGSLVNGKFITHRNVKFSINDRKGKAKTGLMVSRLISIRSASALSTTKPVSFILGCFLTPPSGASAFPAAP
jgi:hypothetical protein